MTTLIVSYDGTDSDRDALALGRLLAGAGASLELAYVATHRRQRTGANGWPGRRTRPRPGGSGGDRHARRAASTSWCTGSTAEGLRVLARERTADAVVFGSEYRTADGHLDPQPTARRLLDGGQVAIALAPAGFVERAGEPRGPVAAVSEDGDPCAYETRSRSPQASASAWRRGPRAAPACSSSAPRRHGGRPDPDQRRRRVPDRARGLAGARAAARRACALRRVGRLMPAESERLRRPLRRRDRVFLGVVAAAVALAAPAAILLAQRDAAPPRLRAYARGRVMGGQTVTRCRGPRRGPALTGEQR